MGKIYDDWERLVSAVARRERDRLLALADSISSASSQLSFPSTSQSDQYPIIRGTSRLPMEYSDLSLDRKEWKEMLPPDKRQLVWRSLSMSFFLDERTIKNCFLLGAMNLMMRSGDLGDCWKIVSHPKSRFSEAAELIESERLYIEANIKTKMLSSETCYAAYLVFGFAETYARLNSAVSIIRNFYDESGDGNPYEQAKMVRFREGEDREDGWMEIKLGEFYVDSEENGEVQVQLLDTSRNLNSGLMWKESSFDHKILPWLVLEMDSLD